MGTRAWPALAPARAGVRAVAEDDPSVADAAVRAKRRHTVSLEASADSARPPAPPLRDGSAVRVELMDGGQDAASATVGVDDCVAAPAAVPSQPEVAPSATRAEERSLTVRLARVQAEAVIDAGRRFATRPMTAFLPDAARAHPAALTALDAGTHPAVPAGQGAGASSAGTTAGRLCARAHWTRCWCGRHVRLSTPPRRSTRRRAVSGPSTGRPVTALSGPPLSIRVTTKAGTPTSIFAGGSPVGTSGKPSGQARDRPTPAGRRRASGSGDRGPPEPCRRLGSLDERPGARCGNCPARVPLPQNMGGTQRG